MQRSTLTAVLLGAVLTGCGPESSEISATLQPLPIDVAGTGSGLFTQLDATNTGIGFENTITEDNNINFYRYQYMYNGGGVAIGDLDNDGLADVYFTGNMVGDKLYHNQGNLQFEDVTEDAGVGQHKGWKAGVNMVDVNNDGLLDIYVARSGWYTDASILKNLLYINQGDMEFEEQAAEYGLADAGHSVHSVFFDYDRDGDLDAYITNHPVAFNQTGAQRLQNMRNPSYEVRDRLYRNDGGTFTDVSKAAGIWNYGHGLGLGVSDLNMDGWPDIYVANDFQSPDFYYVNNGDGTFTEQVKQLFGHTSYFAMGLDIGDINNDLLPDLFTVEMLAADNKRQKTNMAPMNPKLFWDMVDRGMGYQFMRNSMQVNNGNGTFSEAAWLTGLTNTDWSWGPLLADFDNDGDRDLIVTNGYLHDTQDKDYVSKAKEITASKKGGLPTWTELEPHLKSTRIPNFAFRNDGDFAFADVSNDWGFNFAGFSNGVAYGDLDNDGDLDLVVNNINDPALVYRNNSSDAQKNSTVRVRLRGPKGNPFGIGTKLTLTSKQNKQYQEFQVVRGFEGSMEYIAHFGLVQGDEPLALTAEWPDGSQQTITGLKTGGVLEVSHSNAQPVGAPEQAPKPLFAQIGSDENGSLFAHAETVYDDYATEILLPHKQSQYGPAIATGDFNGDGNDDFYVCGAAGQPGVLYQIGDGMQLSTISSPTWQADQAYEDVAAEFFDADGDRDLDLYVVSGSNEFGEGSEWLTDRLYINNNGNFVRANNALSTDMRTFGGCVKAGDYDGDGDQDLFVGGHVVAGKYPYAPRSYVLNNNGGTFTDVTEKVCPALLKPGMVNDALWTDFNHDGQTDLLVVGEWMPISFYQNTAGTLENVTAAMGADKTTGWWWRIIEADLNGDGTNEYIAGNLGQNYKYQAKEGEPFHVYCDDFDENGTFDIVLGYYNDGTCFPVRGRQCSSDQMPFIKKKFPTYEAFGEASINEVYGNALDESLHHEAQTFASSVLSFNGTSYDCTALPREAQFAPSMGLVAGHFNGDSHTDVLMAGNLFVSEVETGRADAGIGLLLTGNGTGSLEAMNVVESGFFAPGDVRDIQLLNLANTPIQLVLVARNNGPVSIFRSTRPRAVN